MEGDFCVKSIFKENSKMLVYSNLMFIFINVESKHSWDQNHGIHMFSIPLGGTEEGMSKGEFCLLQR